jgi:hypothetical protein
MKLDPEINYIVSGIERSGTSMLMQILFHGGIPVSTDHSRQPDANNPLGYFELYGGKIINKIMEGVFPFDQYKGSFIKITAYGLQFLPEGNYWVIYSERDIDEILDSMEEMARITDTNREETKQAFLKMNIMIKNMINKREDIKVLYINYNDILKNPKDEIIKIPRFLELKDADIQAMIKAVDSSLYRK